MMYYTVNYDGSVYTNDNLYVPEYACGNIHQDGMKAFRGLEQRRVDLDLDLPACTKCSIHRFCFQKGDFGELQLRDRSLSNKEFPNCPDIRSHFYDVLSLKGEGAALTAAVNPNGLGAPTPS